MPPINTASGLRSKDSDEILDALAEVLARGVARLDRMIAKEETDGKYDSKVTTALEKILTHGYRLAELRNPKLREKSGVNVNVNAAGQVNQAVSPSELVARVIGELVQQGIPRDRITPEMIDAVMSGVPLPPMPERAAIPVTSTEVK